MIKQPDLGLLAFSILLKIKFGHAQIIVSKIVFRFQQQPVSTCPYQFWLLCVYYLAGLKFGIKKEHLQLKKGDNAVSDFSYIVDNNHGEAVKYVVFGYYENEDSKQIIAIQTENLFFNPGFNATQKYKTDVTAYLTSTAKLKLSKVTEETLFHIVFYCEITYTTSTGLKEKKSEIKLESVCKYATNGSFLFNSLGLLDSWKVLIK